MHDYFLYDWHSEKTVGGLHGFTHAKTACNNAKRDFDINENEQNMILTHVFPLNINPPKTREGVILCVADKICAIYETAHGLIAKFRPKGVLKNDD